MKLNRIDIKWERFILLKLTIWGILLALFSVLRVHGSNQSLDDFISSAYGTINLSNVQNVIPVLIWMLPLLVLNFILGDYIDKQLNQHAVYIFTRTEKRKEWLTAQAISLFSYVIYFHILLQVFLVTFGYVSGFRALSPITMWGNVVLGMITFFLSNILAVFIINLLSLRMNTVPSAAFIIAYQSVVLYLSGIMLKNSSSSYDLIKWFPLTQGVQGWDGYAEMRVSEFSLEGSLFALVYLVTALLIVYLIGLFVIQKRDFY
ncbi:DUF2705 family protein [Paenibacillus herberti]|uniref:Uncharacterized protein n=1 Tax=Paenibacillus herberti TaxID=1619309 RepID=A0A229P3Y5_9BACL|nr:DUF2705 family protein [Paenibacillus herberti]OXM16589.1 hypothetical protein CGZ75_07985 [Paenibacillus herberti]